MKIAPRHFLKSAGLLLATAATTGALSLNATVAHAQGISYTLAPAVSSLQWDKDFGLKNHSLYGGLASIDFERLISLQAFYFTNDKVDAAVNKLGLSGDLANQLKDQRLQVRSMGANVLWKFWSGGVAPFIKTGGGILELRPDSGKTSKQIMLNAGGGLRFGANAPLFLDIFADDMMIRADRYAIFNPTGAMIPVDPDANKLRHNLSIGAAVGIPLGLNTNDRERNAAQSVQWGLSGGSLTLEPFAGRLTFDKKLSSNTGTATNTTRLRDQELAGLRAGIDLGRYVGVRAFYWRGTDKDYKRTESLQSWGGEMQFRLNASPGLTPYLLAGAGKLDFKQDDSTARAQRSDDKVSLILGGGVSLPLGERFALNAAARDYMYGQGNGADSVSSPSDLRHNWMYTVGIRVSIAGKSGSRAAERGVERQRSMGAQMRADSIEWAARLANARPDDRSAMMDGRMMRDSMMMMNGRLVRVDTTIIKRMRADSVRADSTKRAASRVIMLPVPEVGELYVRYGPPQASATTRPGLPISPADSAARRAAETSGPPMTDAERTEAINRRIDSLVAVRVQERTANLVVQAPPTVPPTTVVQVPATASAAVNPTERTYSWKGDDTRGGLLVYSGVTANNGAQILIGGRFDLGPIGGVNSHFHFAPELAFGAGSGGRSTMLVGNAQYMFRKFRLTDSRTIQPHVYGGLGVLNFSDRVGTRDGLEGIINLGYGVSIPLLKNPGTTRAAPVLTVEHQGVDFFQINRLLVGLSWRM
ncbi:MAG: outer membrane beta-barrel protein [Gemmatimonas sp.]